MPGPKRSDPPSDQFAEDGFTPLCTLHQVPMYWHRSSRGKKDAGDSNTSRPGELGRWSCRVYWSDYYKAYLQNNYERESRRGRIRQWREQGINITWDEFVAKREWQNNLCAISFEPEVWRKDHVLELAVDHDRDTGQVRDLLRGQINRGLGAFNHNPELLRRAAAYMDYHNDIWARRQA